MSYDVQLDGEELFVRAKTMGPYDFLNDAFMTVFQNMEKVKQQLPQKLRTRADIARYLRLIEADTNAEARKDAGNAGVSFEQTYSALIKMYMAECTPLTADAVNKSSKRRSLFRYTLTITLEERLIVMISNFPNYKAYQDYTYRVH